MLNVGQGLQIYGRFIPANGKKVPIMIEDHSGGMTYIINKSAHEIVKLSDDNAKD